VTQTGDAGETVTDADDDGDPGAGSSGSVETRAPDVHEGRDARGAHDGGGTAAPATAGPRSDGAGAGAANWLDPWNAPTDDELPGDRMVRIAIDVGVVVFCILFVFLQLGPSNIFKDNTPAGGDMGAHVWGPAYLRDHLLPNLQLTGWTPDWYAGFPAYRYYMVLPPLAIVLLDWGLSGPLIVLPLAVAALAIVGAVREWPLPRRWWLALVSPLVYVIAAICARFGREAPPPPPARPRAGWITIAVVALLFVSLPYGIAFKLVTISGPLALPLCAYAFGRLAGLRFPTPALLAAATLPFLFYRRYSIWGGNLSSMLAGEFAFSIALCLGLLYLGVVLRGIENGKHRALAAGLLALCCLCHLIPFFWVCGATVVIVAVRPRRSTAPVLPCVALGVPGAVLAGIGFLWLIDPHVKPFGLRLDGFLDALRVATWGGMDSRLGPLLLLGIGGLLGAVALWLVSQTARWLLPVLVTAAMLSAFWVGPAVLGRPFMNDFGWEKVPYFHQDETWGDYLLPHQGAENDLRWAFVLAFVGFGLSLALKLRPGIYLGVLAAVNAFAAWAIPEGQLWNARLLPFYYLAVILLAALAVGEVVRLTAALIRPGQLVRSPVGAGTAVAWTLAVVVFVGLPLGALPWDEVTTDDAGQTTGYEFPSWSPWRLQGSPKSYVNSWANWNYTGYEGKASYAEYRDIVTTMGELGQDPDHGCGRAHWEYDSGLDRYGTPMAMMLLPYWTDGCIGSMEGLYFESSMTTPFHFLMQSGLSAAPSNPQRDLPYGSIDADFNQGVQQMQMLGVRYYMAFSDKAVSYARAHPDLTEVASSGPWVVFEVANSDLVVGLPNEPAVLSGLDGEGIDAWLHEPRNTAGQYMAPPVAWWVDPSLWDVMIASDGPADWQRVQVNSDGDVETPADAYAAPEVREVTPAQVSNIQMDEDSISFDVDRTGSPVLVKVSYYPNWTAEGADGPYRVAPNLMVVVPTDGHVELHFTRTKVEWLAYGISLLGLVALIVLIRLGQFRFRDRVASAGQPGANGDATR
jgi:hypothetical protein